MEGIFMALNLSYEELWQKAEALQKEIDACRKAREISQNNERSYRSLVENANEAILVAQNGVFQFANPSAEELFGYSEKELSSKPLTAFINREELNMVMERHERGLKGENLPDLFAFKIFPKDGDIKWIELRVRFFLWNNHPATLFSATDITKRKQAEEKYHRILQSTSEGFILLDSSHVINDVNKSLLRISGYQREEFVGNGVDEFYDKTTVGFFYASRDHLSFEALFRSKTGKMIPMLFNRSTLRDDNGEITAYMYFLTDLTELETTRAEVRKAEQRYRNMYLNALQGMFQSRLSGELIRANPSYARILGYSSPEEVLAFKEGDLKFYFDPEDRAKMVRAVQKKGSLTNYELRLKRKDGKPVWVLANILLINEDKVDGILEGILVDNTKKKALEEKLKRDRKRFSDLAVHDNLTGLYNTRFLYNTLDELITKSKRKRKPLSLVFIDMDDFKQVVDTYGHLNGSEALKEVATTIKISLRKPCFGVAYGGDEFVLVLPGFSKRKAEQKAEEIRWKIKQTIYLSKDGHNVNLGASFGIAAFPDDAEDLSGLLALADQAMFRIKQGGKDSIGITMS
jgi:diguanylate cyclase (GGDEF)-like protein/PAS domain S-box-containing protein